MAAAVTACIAVALAGIARPADARTGVAGSTPQAAADPASGTPKPGAYLSTTKSAAETGKTPTTTGSGKFKSDYTSSDCTDTDGVPYATGLPALPCRPNLASKTTLYQDYGADFAPTLTYAKKSKITIELPTVRFRIFNILCYSNPPPIFPPCPVNLHFPGDDATVSPAGYYGTFATAFVRSPKGVSPQYGTFPPVDVKMLGFGSIPVTATVHITQPIVNGLAVPQQLIWFQSGTVVKPGKLIPGYEQYGASPTPGPGQPGYFFTPPAKLSGPVNVRVDNVKVDGVALPVGSSCQTSTRLKLGAPGGFYQSGSAPVRGEAGGYSPFYSKGPTYLSGTVDLPAFSGCHNGAENLDPLVTGMVSGPDNTVDTTQTAALQNYGCLVNPQLPSAECSGLHPASAHLAADALKGSAAVRISVVQRYNTYVAHHLSALPASVRKLFVAQLGHS